MSGYWHVGVELAGRPKTGFKTLFFIQSPSIWTLQCSCNIKAVNVGCLSRMAIGNFYLIYIYLDIIIILVEIWKNSKT